MSRKHTDQYDALYWSVWHDNTRHVKHVYSNNYRPWLNRDEHTHSRDPTETFFYSALWTTKPEPLTRTRQTTSAVQKHDVSLVQRTYCEVPLQDKAQHFRANVPSQTQNEGRENKHSKNPIGSESKHNISNWFIEFNSFNGVNRAEWSGNRRIKHNYFLGGQTLN